MTGPSRVRTIATLLFGSGLCALVYQVTWLRELRLIFGASTAASAAVLAVFMAGLGVGGLYFGRRADARRDPLALYARLELAIALISAVTPALVWLGRKIYIAMGGTIVLGMTVGTLVRLVLAVLILGAPTFLMGGTLPAAARAAVSREDTGRRSLATLYGMNTFGAVTGATISNFLLLEVFGTRLTLWMACLCNALVAVVAGMIARGYLAEDEARRRDGAAEDEEILREHDDTPAEGPAVGTAFTLLASGLVGFAFLLMELVWYRMLGPILGGSSYTFGLILAVALLGIGAGGLLYSARGKDKPATLMAFATTCGLEAIFIALPYALGDRIALVALLTRPLGAFGFSGHVSSWAIVTGAVVLPASIVSGYQFPLLIALLGKGGADVGKHVGRAYAANTVGAIVGSLAGGFGLIPLLTAPGCWRAVVAILAGLGLGAVATDLRQRGVRPALLNPALLQVIGVLLLLSRGPTAAWRHSPIGAGRADRGLRSRTVNGLRDFLHDQRRFIHWEQDGVESSVAVSAKGGFSFIVNGKSDGSARQDAGTQIMSGLLGSLLFGSSEGLEPKRALVVGLGTGSTAGWLAAVPSIEKVQVVELEPAILRVARDCAPVNQDVLQNPKVSTFIGDAREVLLTIPDTYDLVFSEPSNPYRAGVCSMYTTDYYQAISNRLSESGVLVQWMQAYETDGDAVRLVYTTLSSVFESVETWYTLVGDVIFVASKKRVVHDADVLRARVAAEPYRSALSATWGVHDLEGVLAHHIAAPEFARAVAAQDRRYVNTDDMNFLEFAFARNVGRNGLFEQAEIERKAREHGLDRPRVKGNVDWELWKERRATANILDARPDGDLVRELGPDAQKRVEALARLVSAGDPSEALGVWRSQPKPASTQAEKLLLAGALAVVADPGAEAAISGVAAFSSGDAHVLRSRLLTKKGDLDGAAAELALAFADYRERDPWGRLTRAAMGEAADLVRRKRALGPALFDALEGPFIVSFLEIDRVRTRVRIARRSDFAGLCVAALAPYEPEVPWELGFLELRRDCYERTKSPLLAAADADLAEYLSHSGPPLFFLDKALEETDPPAPTHTPSAHQ